VKEVEDDVLQNVNPLQALARKRKNGPRVFVCCSSGITRSPTVVLAYLVLFKKVSTWRDLSKSDALLRKCHPVSSPNLSLIAKVLEDHKAFQEAQADETETA
jgi:protein-tyrosine phosphatase